jgi:hypothetical protein
MSQYKNIPADFAILKKRILTKAIPLVSISALVGLSISSLSEKNQPIDLYTWIIIILFTSALMIFAVAKSIKAQKENYNNYLLTVGSDSLSRQQSNLPSITLFFNEITQITEDKYGDLLVKGQKNSQIIAISAFIENYDEVKSLLQSVHPVAEPNTKNIFEKFRLLLLLLTLGCMAAVYISTNKIVVAVCGLSLICFMIWSFFKIRSSPQIDNKIKRTAWMMLLVAASITATVYYKVLGS